MNNAMKILALYHSINANPKKPAYSRDIHRVEADRPSRAVGRFAPFRIGTVRHSDR